MIDAGFLTRPDFDDKNGMFGEYSIVYLVIKQQINLVNLVDASYQLQTYSKSKSSEMHHVMSKLESNIMFSKMSMAN